MAVVQDAFLIPEEIAKGLATGLYRRSGGVVRRAKGAGKGQIVKLLDPIDLEEAKLAKGLGSKAIQIVKHHKKEVGITIGVAAAVGVSTWAYKKWKKREPKVLKEFHAALTTYIDAIRNGNLDIEIINGLMEKLEALKGHKDYEKISVRLTAEELEVLVGHIHDYTIKLAKDNAVELSEDELNLNNGAIVNLQSYLKAQKRIFETVA